MNTIVAQEESQDPARSFPDRSLIMILKQLRATVMKTVTVWAGPKYRARQYTQLHAAGMFKTRRSDRHCQMLKQLIPDMTGMRVLDFGCGGAGGIRRVLGDCVVPYDPFVAEFASPPWNKEIDVVFSSDVLEHLTVAEVNEFLDNVSRLSPSYVYLNVSTRSAFKTLPNGANAHLTVRPAIWWLESVQRRLGKSYECIHGTSDLLVDEVTVCFKQTGLSQNADKMTQVS